MSQDTLKNKIQADTIATMRAKDKVRLGVMRLIQAAIKLQEIDARSAEKSDTELNDEQVLALLDKMVKQRRESIEQFTAASRDDLIQKEIFEIEVIQTFLPEPLTSEEVKTLVQQAVKEVGATSMRDMGKIMALLKPKIQGRADASKVAALIKTQFNT